MNGKTKVSTQGTTKRYVSLKMKKKTQIIEMESSYNWWQTREVRDVSVNLKI